MFNAISAPLQREGHLRQLKEASEEKTDLLLVILAYVSVQKADTFFQRYARPVSTVEHFIFDPPEDAFTRCII